jgi:hypothetical protein
MRIDTKILMRATVIMVPIAAVDPSKKLSDIRLFFEFQK